MSLFKRPNSPYWQTDIQVGRRRVVRSTRQTSRRKAEQFEQALREELKREVAERPRTPGLSLDQACGRYWVEHGQHLRDAVNVARYLRYAVERIEPEVLVSELSTKHVVDAITAMRADGVGVISINRCVAVLRGVHNRAAKVWEEPVRAIDWRPLQTKEQHRIAWITPETARELLRHLPDETRHLVAFLLMTGMRKREAFELTWDRVHLDRSIVTIVAKGGKVRHVALSDEAFALLGGMPRTGTHVFDTTNWRRRFDTAKKLAGVPDLRWHDLRHSFATWLGQAGTSLDVIRDLLGHSTVKVTEKYRHIASSEVREALQKVPALSPSSGQVVPLKKA